VHQVGNQYIVNVTSDVKLTFSRDVTMPETQ